jgi:hypothetical protein
MGTLKSRMERIALTKGLVKKAGEKGIPKKRIIAIIMLNGAMKKTAEELLEMCINCGDGYEEVKDGEDYIYGN